MTDVSYDKKRVQKDILLENMATNDAQPYNTVVR